jgi:hypothetical protein
MNEFMVLLVSLVVSDEPDSSRLVAHGESGPCSSSGSNSFHSASDEFFCLVYHL